MRSLIFLLLFLAGSALAQTSVSDDFNRASLGSNWTQTNSFGGTVTIVSNQVSSGHTGDPTIRWSADTFDDDQYSRFELVTFTGFSNTWLSVTCRASTDSDSGRDHYQFAIYDNNSGASKNTELSKIINGSKTVLQTGVVSFTAGDVMEIQCEGTTLRAVKNGSVQYTTTDSDLTSGQPGLMIQQSRVADNWEGGDIVAGGGDDPDQVITMQDLSKGFGPHKSSSLNGMIDQ